MMGNMSNHSLNQYDVQRQLFDSGAVGICTSVCPYVLTLERNYRSGYLLLLPLVHMLKVLDDKAYVS